MTEQPQEFHLNISDRPLAASYKVVDVLAEHTHISKQLVKQAMQKGAVWLEENKGIRRIRRASTEAPLGSVVHFYYSEEVLAQQVEEPVLIADEKQYSVWFKPSGMWSQGSKWGDHCALYRWIEMHQPFTENPQRNAFLVHRLDKATRGLILLAHTKRATKALAALFERREIEKSYRAIVRGEFPAKTQIYTTSVNDKQAYTEATAIGYDPENQQSLVDVIIDTGRKHQIRQHLSDAGYPIVGDRLYSEVPQEVDLQLCSQRLVFVCPLTGDSRDYRAPDHLNVSLKNA